MSVKLEKFGAREKILLYLQENDADQKAIEKGLTLSHSFVSECLKLLNNEGLVKVTQGYVAEKARKVKLYCLTEEGIKISAKIEENLGKKKIIVKDSDGKEKTIMFSELNEFLDKSLNKKFTHAEIISSLEKDMLDIKKLLLVTVKTIDFASERPEIKWFFGRENELKKIDCFISSNSKVLSIRGIPGMGKTVLIIRALENYKQKYNIFWHRFHEFSTLESLLRYLSSFLSSLKKHRLKAHILSKEKGEKVDTLMILEEDLKNVNSILVFDDCHKIKKDLADFLKEFLWLTKRIDNIKIILSGRQLPSIYEKKDVLDGFVKELVLEGLTKKPSLQLLCKRGIRKGVDKIYSSTKGHPLLLQLVKSSETLTDDVYSFLKTEVYDQLIPDEREVLGLSSVFRFPFKGRVFLENNMNIDLVDELVGKSLMQRSSDIYDEHDMIKRFFYKRLSEREKVRYHKIAAEYYMKPMFHSI
jgi:DNA-binding PadR family transcriptional regulator